VFAAPERRVLFRTSPQLPTRQSQSSNLWSRRPTPKYRRHHRPI